MILRLMSLRDPAPCWCPPVLIGSQATTAVDKYTVVKASTAQGAWQPRAQGPFGRSSWGWLIDLRADEFHSGRVVSLRWE